MRQPWLPHNQKIEERQYAQLMMHLVCFDIDGTLVDTATLDADLYSEAIETVLGVQLNKDWSQYQNLTDSGIL